MVPLRTSVSVSDGTSVKFRLQVTGAVFVRGVRASFPIFFSEAKGGLLSVRPVSYPGLAECMGATSFPGRRSYGYDQIRVSLLCLLCLVFFIFIELH